MQDKYIMALDQGTTSSRAIIFDRAGNMISIAQKEFSQIYPHAGWVEHDPMEIWESQRSVAIDALSQSQLNSNQIAAMGITNQRETTVIWDRETGLPIYNAIVWQDRRTAAFCDSLKHDGLEHIIRDKTGLPIDAYFSASKVKWILDNIDGARERAKAGKLAFGTIDSWLVWNLTKGQSHITDVTNASRTMLFNIHTLTWDNELLELLDIPLNILPEVRSSSEHYGCVVDPLLGNNIPITGIAGDQQAALFGQQCTQPGMVKNTYGTGCFMMMNTGTQPVASHNNLITTIAWQYNGQTHYALEGSIFSGGAVVKWLRDGIGLIKSSAEVMQLAGSVKDSDGLYLVPAFAGLGSPHWNQEARGSMFGATQGTTAAHIARAGLESIAYQTRDVLKAMEADSGIDVPELRVDGGASVNDLLMQLQADILELHVIRPKVTETTALGAAYFAGLAVGYWNDIDDVQGQWQLDKRFNHSMSKSDIAQRIKGWQRAVDATCFWADQN